MIDFCLMIRIKHTCEIAGRPAGQAGPARPVRPAGRAGPDFPRPGPLGPHRENFSKIYPKIMEKTQNFQNFFNFWLIRDSNTQTTPNMQKM